MVRGGRVSPMQGFFANLFNLKPIVSLDNEGKGTLAGKSISRKRIWKKILKKAQKIQNNFGLEKYAVVHAGAPEKARDFAQKMRNSFNQKPEYIMEISAAVALNAGPGAVALSIMGAKQK